MLFSNFCHHFFYLRPKTLLHRGCINIYIEIKIEIACDQNKLNFRRALIGLAKETFFDF